ncbi:hypothetical protein BN1263310008 [Stenotrophomonas thermophila]|nr:hypothetical protein BN1263310008 [Stenotrophomonas maltophilia]
MPWRSATKKAPHCGALLNDLGHWMQLVGREGFEPSTKRLKGAHSSPQNQMVTSAIFPGAAP